MPPSVWLNASLSRDILLLCSPAALLMSGCGGYELPPPPESPEVRAAPLMVRADPPGHEFSEPTIVRLRPMAEFSVDIFYTLDGSSPTGDGAQVYTGALELESTTLLNFIARDASGAWSEPGSELYTVRPEVVPVADVARALHVSPGLVFFAWKPGDPSPMHEAVTLTAVGREPVTIDSVRLIRNPSGQFFWETGAFVLEWPAGRVRLAPGESAVVDVAYAPTATFRSAAIEVLSDDEQRDGRTLVELWGRTSAW